MNYEERKKEYKMSNDELLAHLVSSLTKKPHKDMSIAINEILRRMNAAQQTAIAPLSPSVKHVLRKAWEDGLASRENDQVCAICNGDAAKHANGNRAHDFTPRS